MDLRKNKALTPVESGFPIVASTIDLTTKCNLQCKYCNPAGTPILMSDLTYKPIEEVKVGDEIMGFVIPEEKGKHTYFTKAIVEGNAKRSSDIIKVSTTNGDFRCTPDHRWFNGRSYVPAKVGMDIKYVSDPVYFEETDDYKLGYIHGMMAGDGTFSEGEHVYKSGPQEGRINKYHHLRLALNDIEGIDRVERYVSELNLGTINRFQYTEKMIGLRSGSKDLFDKMQGLPNKESSIDYLKGWAAGIFDAEGSHDGNSLRIAQLEGKVLESIIYTFNQLDIKTTYEDYKDVKVIRIINGYSEIVKFFAMCNPAIQRKKAKVLEGKSVYGNSIVEKIESDGYEDVYSLQTSTGNYIAHGHTSKNCFTNLSKGDYSCTDLTLYNGKKIINWLMLPSTRGNSSTVDISFWGGEPLLKWDMFQTLVLYAEEKAAKYGIDVSFGATTNVTLLTPDKFDFIDTHNIGFLLSVDGTKEHHDENRIFENGAGSWNIIDKNLTKIIERWPNSNVRLSYSCYNIETLLDDLKYFYDKGLRSIAYSPVSEDDWTEEKIASLHKTWREISEWWVDLYKKGDAPYVKYIEDSCRREFIPEGDQAPCGAGRGYVGIDTDGVIRPCHRFHKFNETKEWYEQETVIGHIDYGILNQDFREKFMNWSIHRDMPEDCKECEGFGTHCTGGCWATNWDINGDISMVSPIHCEEVKANMDSAKYVNEELGSAFTVKYQGFGQTNNLPMVQGCQCYNVEDNMYGRKTVNKNDPYSCLCNMATYGSQPRQAQQCHCYNIEDDFISHYDMSGAQCKSFTLDTEHQCGGHEDGHECKCKSKNPIEEAIKYIQNLDPEKLSEEDMESINRFIEYRDLL